VALQMVVMIQLYSGASCGIRQDLRDREHVFAMIPVSQIQNTGLRAMVVGRRRTGLDLKIRWGSEGRVRKRACSILIDMCSG
jgi:hypothetical protein